MPGPSRRRAADVQVAALSSTIAKLLTVPEGIVHLRSTYPMSRYFAAFDLAVSAAGYNAYHELIRFGVPALYVPMPRQTDDQAARARYAEQAGIGLAADGPDSDRIEALLDELLDPERRAAMRRRLGELRLADGAAEAARWLGQLARAEGEPARHGVGAGGAGLAEPLRSARRAAPFAARLPLHVAAFVRQTIVRRPPRTVVLALDVAQGALERELADALARTPDPPGRVLVVTNSLDFAPLRRAGVGVRARAGPRRGSGAAGRRRLRFVPAPQAGADPCRAPSPSPGADDRRDRQGSAHRNRLGGHCRSA